MIVHIITGLDVGGAETMLCRLLLAKKQPAEGQMVISLKTVGPIGAELQRHGVRVEALGMGANLRSLTVLFRLTALLKRIEPDVVQTWMYHADLLGGLAARMAGVPKLVWGIRGTYTPIGRPWTHRVMKLCAKLSFWLPDKILCVAQAAQASHIAYGYAADKMQVIPNGLDFQAFALAAQQEVDFRQLAGWSSEDILIGCVGRYHPDKGQDVLLQAAALLKHRNAKVRFVIIGRGCESDNPALASLLAQHELQQHVLLLGERQDIPACLAGFDIFCLPSRTEGFPNVLAEAMTAALPAVATNVGDVALLTGDEMTLVPANNAEALARQLQLMLSHSDAERRAMGQANRQRVMDNFSIAAIRQRYDAFYQQLQEL